MATSTDDPALQADLESENIPTMTTIVPSMFTPLEDDLLDRLEPPKDRIERLQRILENIDTHEKKVLDNALWMVEREKRRIIIEAKRVEESFYPPEAQLGIDPDETDILIQNMRAAPEPGVDYNVMEIQLPRHDIVQPNFSHREDTTRQLLDLVEKASRSMEHYKTRMKAAKDFYQDRLQKEITRDEEFSKRPEAIILKRP